MNRVIAYYPRMDETKRMRVLKRSWLTCLMNGSTVEEASNVCIYYQNSLLKTLGLECIDSRCIPDNVLYPECERDRRSHIFQIFELHKQIMLRLRATDLKKFKFHE